MRMAFNLCRRTFSTFSTIKKCSVLFKAQPVLKSQAAVTSKLIPNTNLILQTGFATEERPRLGLRKQNLPPFPYIECVRELVVETFLPSRYKIVKYGDYEFLESDDGYVNVYVQGYQHPRNLDAKAGYAVYFLENHPLNSYGKVERRQKLNHAKLYSFLMAMQRIPKGLFTKVCICVDEIPLITFIDRSLRNMSENSFRSVHTGKLNKDLETSMGVNKEIRMRQDLTLRLKYVPNDIGVDGMYRATKLATKAAQDATQESRLQQIETKYERDENN
ncbi:uncharacterized protein LOC129566152 [Sitodiplosis mosellana]|uniref:uncharacterized protein LOC129566152 n=1 Tax=Sitodiplosis mosellana TaxID=263140 RepID=UPI00244519B2|nr:uncharacterized protein LOC129566152 [Sitodiplosis mosellana]